MPWSQNDIRVMPRKDGEKGSSRERYPSSRRQEENVDEILPPDEEQGLGLQVNVSA